MSVIRKNYQSKILSLFQIPTNLNIKYLIRSFIANRVERPWSSTEFSGLDLPSSSQGLSTSCQRSSPLRLRTMWVFSSRLPHSAAN